MERSSQLAAESTSEERARFQEEFHQRTEAVRRFSRGVSWFFPPILIPLVFLMLGWHSDLIWPLPVFQVAFTGLIVYSALRRPKLQCPACSQAVEDAKLGKYCPECGAESLVKEGWPFAPKCNACDKKMKRGRGKSRFYKIRHCTHCGLHLEDAGF